MRMLFVVVCTICLTMAEANADSGGKPDARLAIAEATLSWLQGEWRFELGERTGTRIVEAVYPDHVISWREKFDNVDLEGRGFLGYSPTQDQIYNFSIHNVAGEYALMTGEMNESGNEIVYVPASDVSEPYKVVWRRENDEKFTYTLMEAADNGAFRTRWTAVFTRVK